VDCFIAVMVCIAVGFIAGYLTARSDYRHHLDVERVHHESCLADAENRYRQTLKDIDKAIRIDAQETAKRHTKLLDEISQVTGIDKVELPSFGVVYLNHSKNVREAMQALYEEDLSDGAYD